MSEPTSSPLAEPNLSAALEIIDAANNRGAQVRVLGGIAVALRCPSTRKAARLHAASQTSTS